MEEVSTKVILRLDNANIEAQAKLINSAEKLKVIANKKAWLIFQELTKKESYARALARKFKLAEQEAHYYLKKLEEAGFIKEVKKEKRSGGIAKYYKVESPYFVIAPESPQESFEFRKKIIPKPYKEFFEPFIKDGFLNAKIIVGSPDAHGTYKARARDAHIAIELGCFLGSLAESFNYPLVQLDTSVKSLEEENSNLIVIGGPIINKVSLELNEYLPIKFEKNRGFWSIKSELSMRTYSEDFAGIIEKVEHPFFDDKAILYIAGRRNAGTRAAIMSLITNTESIVVHNKFSDEHYAHVVEGLDLNSDGLIDHVEILE